MEYRIGDFKIISDYRILDLCLNLSDYRISDSGDVAIPGGRDNGGINCLDEEKHNNFKREFGIKRA